MENHERMDLQDELLGALIGLVHACQNNPKTAQTDSLLVEGLYTIIAADRRTDASLQEMTARVRADKAAVAPNCVTCTARCGNTDDYDMKRMWKEKAEIRSLKIKILAGISGIAAAVYPVLPDGCVDEKVYAMLHRALFALGEDWEADWLLPIVQELSAMKQYAAAIGKHPLR